jgi:hypothetical protein
MWEKIDLFSTVLAVFGVVVIMTFVCWPRAKQYNIRTMERPCVNCDLWMKEYKKISEKQLEYHLSRFEFMKKYDLIDTMIIDTIH